MSNRGTANDVSISQFATVASSVGLALPKALQLCGLDIKSVIDLTNKGEDLSFALGQMFKNLANPIELEVHRCDNGFPRIKEGGLIKFDQNNSKIRTIYPSKILLRTYSQPNQPKTNGFETRERLLTERLVLLDSAVMEALLLRPEQIPAEMSLPFGVGTRRIFFDGATFQDSGGQERSFFMRYSPSRDRWTADDFPLANIRNEGDFVAVLKV